MRRLICVVGALALVACGGDSTGPAATLDGTYELRTVNGAALPFTTFQNATEKDELLGDAITASNVAFSQLTFNRVTVNGHITNGTSPNSGSYVIIDTVITFTSVSGFSWTGTGTISGNTLTVAFTVANGGSGLYARR